MNKGQLVEAIAKRTGSSKAAAEKGLNAARDSIKGTLKKGNSVRLLGFGTFLVKRRAARVGINPQTNAKMRIKAKKVPVFCAGAVLRSV